MIIIWNISRSSITNLSISRRFFICFSRNFFKSSFGDSFWSFFKDSCRTLIKDFSRSSFGDSFIGLLRDSATSIFRGSYKSSLLGDSPLGSPLGILQGIPLRNNVYIPLRVIIRVLGGSSFRNSYKFKISGFSNSLLRDLTRSPLGDSSRSSFSVPSGVSLGISSWVFLKIF